MPGVTVIVLLVFTATSVAATVTSAPGSAPADVRFGTLPDTNTIFQPADYPLLAEWKKRREWLRMQVRVAVGLWPEPARCPLNAHISGKIDGDGYTIEKVYFESYPGFYVTGNLYRGKQATEPGAPATGAGKFPGVLCPHGHWEHGRLQQTELCNVPARCITLARMGCTVLAYDMVGYNDSKRQIDHRINTPALDLWGITSMHLQTWNSIRAIDFLQSLPEVDPVRIGVTGASGGGTQTFILSAVDDRVSVTAPVNMISHTMQGGCVCENAPCLRIETNNMEIGALMAPKPMLMVSASGDWTKDTPKVEYPFIQSIYALYGKKDNVVNFHVDAGHNYNQKSREAMYRFFARHLLDWPEEKASAITERDIPGYKAEELLVWTDESVPPGVLKWEQLSNQLQAATGKQVEPIQDQAEFARFSARIRQSLEHMIGSDPSMPMQKSIAQANNPHGLIVRRADRNLSMFYQPTSRTGKLMAAEMCFTPGGQRLPRAVGAIRVLPRVFGGKSADVRSEERVRAQKNSFFTTFNRSDSAETIFDMGTAFMSTGTSNATLGWRAESLLGPPALVARAMLADEDVKRRQIRTVIDMNRFDIDNDDAYLKELNIPHIRRIGGLRAIAAVACNGSIWFHNVGDHFDEAFVTAAGRINGVEVRVTKEKASDTEVAEWLMR